MSIVLNLESEYLETQISRNVELYTTLLLNLLGAGRSGDLELKKKGVLVRPPWFSEKVDWRKFTAPTQATYDDNLDIIKGIFHFYNLDMKTHNDHPVAGEPDENGDEDDQLGEPVGVAVEPAGGVEEEEIMADLAPEEEGVEEEDEEEIVADFAPEEHDGEGEELELNLSDSIEDEEDDGGSSGKESDVSEDDGNGEGGRDGEEEGREDYLPDPEAPLTDQQMNSVARHQKRVVSSLEPARKSKRTRRIPRKFLHFI